MFRAPFVCLAHNMFEEGVDDPTFTYANRAVSSSRCVAGVVERPAAPGSTHTQWLLV